jgi:cytidylate kinase
VGIPTIIAIDGPAASGKSTLGQKLAQALGYLFFDTGVMYRAVTWLALKQGIDIGDEQAITSLAEQGNIDVRPPSAQDGRAYDVIVDGRDITWQIRQPEIERNVSPVSAFAGVRKALTAQQRRIGNRGKVVMVGRDIGTVVLPNAGLKIYLDASVEERARRRYLELIGRGEPAHYETILEAMKRRDRIDSQRQVAPLRPAEDALILCSDGLDIEQVFEQARAMVFGK